jgi:hypothetical protein
LAETSAPLTISNTSTAGDRIEPELASMPVWNFRNGVSVRDWAVGETRTVTFALSIDPTADNRYQGARAAVDFRWESTSLSGAITATAPGTVAGTGSVAGTLTGPSGALASQSVQLFPLGGAPLGTTTGTDGSFTFPTVASGTYNVVSWVDAVPVVKTVSVVAGQQSTVAMVATPVDRTVAVTVSPAPTADAPWWRTPWCLRAQLSALRRRIRRHSVDKPLQ